MLTAASHLEWGVSLIRKRNVALLHNDQMNIPVSLWKGFFIIMTVLRGSLPRRLKVNCLDTSAHTPTNPTIHSISLRAFSNQMRHQRQDSQHRYSIYSDFLHWHGCHKHALDIWKALYRLSQNCDRSPKIMDWICTALFQALKKCYNEPIIHSQWWW